MDWFKGKSIKETLTEMARLMKEFQKACFQKEEASHLEISTDNLAIKTQEKDDQHQEISPENKEKRIQGNQRKEEHDNRKDGKFEDGIDNAGDNQQKEEDIDYLDYPLGTKDTRERSARREGVQDQYLRKGRYESGIGAFKTLFKKDRGKGDRNRKRCFKNTRKKKK